MKKLLSLIVLGLALTSLSAWANDNYGRRYKTSYRNFDRGFYSYYGYHESAYHCNSYTCLESSFSNSSTVYIQETIIYDQRYGEQRMVRVYENESYRSEIVTYYVGTDHNRNIVRGRRYNPNYHYYNTYYSAYTPFIMPNTYLTLALLDQFDSESAKLLVTGGIVTDIGITIAQACDTSDCGEIAAGIALAGLGSQLIASSQNEERKKQKTGLETAILNSEKASSSNLR